MISRKTKKPAGGFDIEGRGDKWYVPILIDTHKCPLSPLCCGDGGLIGVWGHGPDIYRDSLGKYKLKCLHARCVMPEPPLLFYEPRRPAYYDSCRCLRYGGYSKYRRYLWNQILWKIDGLQQLVFCY